MTPRRSSLLPSSPLIWLVLAAASTASLLFLFIANDQAGTGQTKTQARQKEVRLAIHRCLSAEIKTSCFNNTIVPLVQRDGPIPILSALSALSETDPSILGPCHALTHVVGHATFEQSKSLPTAYAAAGRLGNVCSYGFYHGVMEEFAGTVPKAELLANLGNYCSSTAQYPQSMDHWNCIHGLGHGLSGVENDDWRAALNDCATLPDAWQRRTCSGGVFMQNVISESVPDLGHKFDFQTADILYPCSVVDSQWQETCYYYQADHMYAVLKSYPAVFTTCENLAEPNRHACLIDAGTSVAFSNWGQTQVIVSLCRQAGSGNADCLAGAARAYAFHYNSQSKALTLCAQGGDMKKDCRDQTMAFTTERRIF